MIPWTDKEKNGPNFIQQLKDFDATIRANDKNSALSDEELWAIDFLQLSDDLGYSPNETINTAFNAIDLSSESINNEPLFTSEPALNALLDEHIGSLIKIPYKEEHAVVEVLDRKRTNHIDNRLVGRKRSDPTLDTRRYTVRMPNSEIREYTANLVAENLFAQCDDDGNYAILLDEIIDHKHDETATPIGQDTYYDKRYGKNLPVQNFQGWFLCVRWKDDSLSWVPLKYMYESDILGTAEYAVVNKLCDWPAFKWWVEDALKTRETTIAAVKSGYWTRREKFGIPLPKSAAEALHFDEENAKKGLPRLWKPAIDKEMNAVMIAFEFVGHNKPDGYKDIRCHLVYDITMNLTRKARMVAEGNLAKPDSDVPVYASVVSRESVRILFTIASLNNMKVRAADITNAFLNAPCLENICFKAGPEFGDKEGQWVIVGRALYGLVSSSAAFAIHRNQVLCASSLCMKKYFYLCCLRCSEVESSGSDKL